MSKQKQIIYIDASSLKHSACFRHFYRVVVRGLRPNTSKVNLKLLYGKAIHKALEIYYETYDSREAIIAAQKTFKLEENACEDIYEFRTPLHLVKTLEKYFETYTRQTDGIKATSKPEQNFAIPVYEDENFAIVLCGIIDINGEYHGQHCLVDHKTTAMYVSKKDDYFNTYKLDIQMMMYVYIDNLVNKRGDKYLPIVINALFLKKPTLAAIKDKVFDGATFHRSELIEFSKEQIDSFKLWLEKKILRLVTSLRNPSYALELSEADFDLACCREPYGLCTFFDICRLPKEYHEEALKGLFIVETYNPLSWYE